MMENSPFVFDRHSVRRNRERAARLAFTDRDQADAAFLQRAAADEILDRLSLVRREFHSALDLGCGDGYLARALRARGVSVVAADLAPSFAKRAAKDGLAICADEEALPFAEGCFDLVVSGLSLHWVNDLPGALLQIRRILKPDGLFLGCLLGGGTLQELRQALEAGSLATLRGVSPRVSPFASLEAMAGLMQRAGFALPVVDQDTLVVRYASFAKLLTDLRAMGETNAVAARARGFTRRTLFAEAARHYAENFTENFTGKSTGPDGDLRASFVFLHVAGWAPHENQQKALRPGAAQQRLADVLYAKEEKI